MKRFILFYIDVLNYKSKYQTLIFIFYNISKVFKALWSTNTSLSSYIYLYVKYYIFKQLYFPSRYFRICILHCFPKLFTVRKRKKSHWSYWRCSLQLSSEKFGRFLLGSEGLLQIFNFIHVVLWRRTDTKEKILLSVPFSNAFDEHWYWQVWNKHREGTVSAAEWSRRRNTAKYPICEGICALWSIDFVIQTWRLSFSRPAFQRARDGTL